jgi:hypothetical protein
MRANGRTKTRIVAAAVGNWPPNWGRIGARRIWTNSDIELAGPFVGVLLLLLFVELWALLAAVVDWRFCQIFVTFSPLRMMSPPQRPMDLQKGELIGQIFKKMYKNWRIIYDKDSLNYLIPLFSSISFIEIHPLQLFQGD